MQTIAFDTLIDLDRRAVEATMRLAAIVQPSDRARPTPCADWTVADLLAHMTGQQLGFAAAARGHGADSAIWAPRDDSYAMACGAVLMAFGRPGLEAQPFQLPEIAADRAFPARLAVGFHLVDNVVHAWDLAVSLDVRPQLDAEAVSAALPIARQVPNGNERTRPGAAFAPALTSAAADTDLDRILVLLGRRPDWVSPRTAWR